MKNEITVEGKRLWCLVNQNEVMIPSGNVGESGERGDKGEWSTGVREDFLDGSSPTGVGDGDKSGGLAL